jgi:hypothetical protein
LLSAHQFSIETLVKLLTDSKIIFKHFFEKISEVAFFFIQDVLMLSSFSGNVSRTYFVALNQKISSIYAPYIDENQQFNTPVFFAKRLL